MMIEKMMSSVDEKVFTPDGKCSETSKSAQEKFTAVRCKNRCDDRSG